MQDQNTSQYLNDIVFEAPIGVCIVDAGSMIAEIVNDRFIQVAGRTREVISGQHFWTAFPEVRVAYEDDMNSVIATGKTFRAEEVAMQLIRHGKPENVYVSFVYSPIRNKEGRVIKISIWVLENTTEVVERERINKVNRQLEDAQATLQSTYQQLEESEIALRLAINAANFGTWYIHSVTRAFITDARLKELFGYFPHESLSIEQALAQITDEYRPYVATALENAIYNGGDYDVVYPVTGFHNNRKRWLRAIGNLKADPSGSFSAFTGVVMDITEQKVEEQRKNDFIGMVSHELKTPLTSLNGYLQVLDGVAGKQSPELMAKALTRSRNQIRKMTTMINGFLNVSRLESGRIPIEKSRFDLAALLSEIAEETATLFPGSAFTFHPVEHTPVNADRDKIGQVINNYISNAVNYSPLRGMIRISCQTINGQAVLNVADEGIGISADDAQHIFERFYRVQDNQQVSGFGIGLYICSEIIQRHDGRVWVESASGKGSTFSFSIPVI